MSINISYLKNRSPYIVLFFLGLFPVVSGLGQELTVDFNKIIKRQINSGAAGANLCWLTDSDIHNPDRQISMKTALKKLGVGSLRFPYGHLADNYLWHSPPYNDTLGGLRPKVAAPSRPPWGWEWAVDDSGYFKSAMDFDEYIAICQKLNIRPLVVVNVFSHTYNNGPKKEELVTAAVEWVKYAKQKNYKVAYWQIGNEVDHHKKLLSREDYISLYQTFASNMKTADRKIKIGPGILSDTTYFTRIVSKYPDLIDFVSSHQYAWPYIKECSTYEKWKEHQSDYIPNVNKMQVAVESSGKPEMEILITETGVTPTGKGMGDINNTYKALWFFEMLMNEIKTPNHAYSYFWGTHSPWNGPKDTENKDAGVLLRMDDNSQKPIAQVVQMVNANLLDTMVETSQIKEFVRLFASRKSDNSNVSLFLVNRNDKSTNVHLSVQNLPESIQKLQRKILYGDHPESKRFSIRTDNFVEIRKGVIKIKLPPLSITILKN